ncbi:hypothetical protein IRJ41_006968 [Triplophysa rosa]|uniref:B30.2/SPRY domain-containing protein n=1 Tax=Triplophysa rosa TaxID=992332 RepID=A0A9W7TXM3_TRIRA|nr:hypothetical protein IRJ41_006968 [Triplophysa rosa]
MIYESVHRGRCVYCKSSTFSYIFKLGPQFKRQRRANPEPSVVSMKSGASMNLPPALMQTCSRILIMNQWMMFIMKNKYERLFEGMKAQENQTLLKRIYTQLSASLRSHLDHLQTSSSQSDPLQIHHACDRNPGLRRRSEGGIFQEENQRRASSQFLLGISLESNQRLLQDLLTHTHNSSKDIRKITHYIKDRIKGRNMNDDDVDEDEDEDYDDEDDERLSSDRSINLFLCLSEVKDQTLYREIEEFVRSDKHSKKKLSAAHCSAIAYMLQMSEEVMDEFDLKKYNTTQEGRRRLIPAVINCTRALWSGCNLSDECCESLSSCLQSSTSLRELDLSNNDLQDSGVKLISDALKTHNCQLHTLRLSRCDLTDGCCESLSSCLQSSTAGPLSNNDLKDSGVKLISDALKTHNCQLHTLRLFGCDLTDGCCESLSSCLQSSTSLRELDLSDNDLKDSGVKLISDALKTHNCQLHTLRLSGCMVTDEGCCYLASALSSNPSHLRELDLSYNHPQHSALQLLSDRLNDPNYTLNTLNVSHGGQRRITAGPRKYACDVTLDPNTANTELKLSEENRKITRVRERQSYPDHPDRFDGVPQVLCRESLTGRCYWEAEWSESDVLISVSYKSINRKGKSDSVFGHNVKSWSLECSDDGLAAYHNGNETVIDVYPDVCERAGVYVDEPAGTLSFYSVSDTHTLTHLHTFYTTFTEPLYAGFAVFETSSVSLCDINSLYRASC